MGDPPVLSLWPPQLDLLNGNAEPAGSVRCGGSCLSFPTSAGKTLDGAVHRGRARRRAARGRPASSFPPTALAARSGGTLTGVCLRSAAEAEDAGPLGLPLPAYALGRSS